MASIEKLASRLSSFVEYCSQQELLELYKLVYGEDGLYTDCKNEIEGLAQ